MAGVEGKKAPEDQQASAPSRATAMATPRDVALHFRILPYALCPLLGRDKAYTVLRACVRACVRRANMLPDTTCCLSGYRATND